MTLNSPIKITECIIRILFVVFLMPSLAHAQNLSEYNWYLGTTDASIRFGQSSDEPQLINGVSALGGVGSGVTISDPVTGNILMYTDGQSAYDLYDNLITSTTLNGDPNLNTSVVVIARPYSVGEYHILTNTGAAIEQSVFSRITNDFVSSNIPVAGLNNPAEGMIVIRQDIDNYWLITQDVVSTEISVTEVNSGVVGATTNYNLWNTTTALSFEISSFAYDPVNGKLAAAPKTENRNVTLFDFDSGTGVLTLDDVILNTGRSDGLGESIYDLEWSASGDLLYISRFGSAATDANVYQYDVNSTVTALNSILPASVFRSFGLKRGPDNHIYHLYQSSSTSNIELGVITAADSTFNNSDPSQGPQYDPQPLDVTNIAAQQFPTSPEEHFETFNFADIMVLDTCANRTTKLFSSVSPTPTSYEWDFGDGGDPSDAVNPVYTYETAGNFTVTLRVSLNGITETVTKDIEIVAGDLSIDLGTDTVLCAGETLTLDAGAGALSYAWNTDETSQSIVVDTTGVYSVSVISSTGCVYYDYIGVTTYGDTTTFRNQWYFGEGAGIDFDDDSAPIEDANLIMSPQASSSVSDLNGELLFYTDGETVWNQEHNVMVNGDLLGGNNESVQGAMIVPMPGDTTTYYIFTTDSVGEGTYELKYSIVDMKLDQARGEVVVKDQVLMKNSSEKMTAIGLGTNATMLYVHEFGNNNVRAYRLTEDGIEPPVISSAGTSLRFNNDEMGTAEMQIGTGVLAVAIQDTPDNYVELLQVNDTTGEVSELALININETDPVKIYGLEFSSSMEKLYVSTNGSGSKLIQFDLDSLFGETPVADIEGSKFVLGTSSAEFGALSTGSDGIIYMAINNSSTLGTITSPNEDDAGAGFVESGFDLASRTSRLGLPNFVADNPVSSQQPGISISNACLGQSTLFIGTGTSIIDEYFWTFGDGTSSTNETDSVTYNLEGDYPISLRITNRCGLDTLFNETATVNAIPAAPTVEDAANICQGAVTLEAWPSDSVGLSYTWSNGETTREITVDEPILLSVFITDTNGCNSNTRTTFVDDTSPTVDLGADQFICQNVAFADLNANNPGSSFVWTINGTDTGNGLSVQPVETFTAGTFEYAVEVTDIFSCVGTDTLLLTINPTPDADAVAVATTGACGSTDGQIDLTINETGDFFYQLTGTAVEGPTAVAGSATYVIDNGGAGLGAGNYTVAVTNVISGCVNSISTPIADGGVGYTIDATNTNPGCDDAGEITITLGTAPPANIDYELYDQLGTLLYNGTLPVAAGTGNVVIANLDSGNYDLVLEEVGGCIRTQDNIQLNSLPYADFLVQPEVICGTEGQIGISPVTVDAVISYTWTPAGNIVGTNVGDSVIVSTGGTYTVTSGGTGYCPQIQNVNVTQNSAPAGAITIDGDVCDGERLATAEVTSSAVGNLSYQWSDGLLSTQRTITEVGDYTVTFLDQGTGCSTTITQNIEVYPELTVFQVSEPNCDNTEEIFIDAYANITEDVTFTWTLPDGTVLSDTTAEWTASESGTYTVDVASTVNVCTATSSFDAQVVPILDSLLVLPNRDGICPIDPNTEFSEVTLDAGSFASYAWSLQDEPDTLSTDRFYTVTEVGWYEVRITNGFTCITDIVEIYDDCRPVVHTPNAFTPDGNGVNDTYFVYDNPYVHNFNIKIYSRWGEKVYETNDVNFNWTGAYEGELLQGGTYVYVMTFESWLQPELGEIQQRGSVALIR
ncbi:PKD domain-containing protein [Reichenbachiella versicolor]|uniref:PKD domain-containing protein n=1 Tax=Reichenbachiella versicolor TaxID=1821036 RepID=UPI000D6E81A4|nr:PKD domain-containing protein [Reichenbachiella versicolor]